MGGGGGGGASKTDASIARVTHNDLMCYSSIRALLTDHRLFNLGGSGSGELTGFLQFYKLLPKLTIDTPGDSNLCLCCDGPNFRRPKMLKYVSISWWHHHSTEQDMMPFALGLFINSYYE